MRPTKLECFFLNMSGTAGFLAHKNSRRGRRPRYKPRRPDFQKVQNKILSQEDARSIKAARFLSADIVVLLIAQELLTIQTISRLRVSKLTKSLSLVCSPSVILEVYTLFSILDFVCVALAVLSADLRHDAWDLLALAANRPVVLSFRFAGIFISPICFWMKVQAFTAHRRQGTQSQQKPLQPQRPQKVT